MLAGMIELSEHTTQSISRVLKSQQWQRKLEKRRTATLDHRKLCITFNIESTIVYTGTHAHTLTVTDSNK